MVASKSFETKVRKNTDWNRNMKRNISTLLTYIGFFASILVRVQCACYFSSTECSCAFKPGTGTCYSETSPGFCTAAPCAASWKCDCLQPTHLCSRSSCSRYELLDDGMENLDGDLPCVRMESTPCLRVQEPLAEVVTEPPPLSPFPSPPESSFPTPSSSLSMLPSPTPSPYPSTTPSAFPSALPSASMSAIPSLSSSVSPTPTPSASESPPYSPTPSTTSSSIPSTSMSPIPSPTPSVTPTPSATPSITPSPSVITIPLGGYCVDTQQCAQTAPNGVGCILRRCREYGRCDTQLDAFCRSRNAFQQCCPRSVICPRYRLESEASFCGGDCSPSCNGFNSYQACMLRSGGGPVNVYFGPINFRPNLPSCGVTA